MSVYRTIGPLVLLDRSFDCDLLRLICPAIPLNLIDCCVYLYLGRCHATFMQYLLH